MKKNYLLILLYISLQVSGQVGIKNTNPTSTLTVNGSLAAKYNEVSQSTYTITSEDYHIAYVGSQAGTIILPSIATGNSSFTGRFYKIKNLSSLDLRIQASDNNTMMINGGAPIARYTIPPGGLIEAINNKNSNAATWNLGYMGNTPERGNASLYSTQLTVPPHNIPNWTNHSNTNYDSGPANDRWWIVRKDSFNYEYRLQTDANGDPTYHKPSKMTIIYEYQGQPLNTVNLYPILTPGNTSDSSDVFVASFIRIQNVGGKTRLTVTIVKSDLVGNAQTGGGPNDDSNWKDPFLMNVLLVATTPQ